ncbi:hypothetical protein ACFVS2_22035 [Brevibacillus sp. NPDC058079]|uniref:hypothetical protein n=1 Tax=Brevibacillus sp. NPDC058079 TaxID=3346330 RepID=UPI0036EC94E6
MKFQSLKRGCATLLALLFILSAFLSPVKSNAHEAYFFQVLIDENQYLYQGNILADDADWLGSETGHMEAQFGDFSELIKNPYRNIPQKGNKVEETKVSSQQPLPFTFSPEEKGDSWFDDKPVNDASKEDVDRAYFVKDTLIPSLNDALRLLNNNKEFEDMAELLAMSSKLGDAVKNGSGQIGEYSIRKGRASYSSSEPTIDKKTGIGKNDYITISKMDKNTPVEYEFVYQVVKGYKSKGNWDNKVYNPAYNHDGDAEYMTWNMVMYQAVYAYSAKGMTAKDGAKIAKPGALEEAVTWLFESLYNGIRNLLGLFSLGELIYNDGIRGSSAWHYGVMPMSWEKNVMLYHWIFQAIAWTIISFSIAKLLITRNISTINPSMRVSLIEGLQDLLITGLILAFIMPIINLLMNFNMKIVDVFAAVGPDLDKVMGVNNYSNLLAGVIIQFFFLFIAIYLNYTYIIRSITVAVLTAMAPLFVITLSLGGKWKGLFSQWMKELVSNIFLQSFHAFILGFLFISTISSRGIEALVVCFSLIPLTEFFRSMMMGQAGGIASRVGMGTVVAGAALMMGAGDKAMSMGQKRVQNSNGQSGSQSGSQNGGTTNNAGSDLKTGNSDRLRNNNGAVDSRTMNQDRRNAMLDKEVPLDIAQKGSDSADFKQFVGGEVQSEKAVKMADFKDNLKSDYLSKEGISGMVQGVGKAALGATAMAAGAGYALAFGAENAGAANAGAKVAGSGGRLAYSSGKSGMNKVSSDISTGISLKAPTAPNSTTQGTSTPATPTPSNQGAMLDHSSAVWQRSLPNGDSQVHRDGTVLSEQGILRANDDSYKNAVYTYDVNKLNEVDSAQIQSYANTFRSGDAQQIEHLRSQGVERVAMNADGQYMVSYNQVGKNKLGIQSVQTMGDGRIVETKSSSQPMSTRVTFDVTKAPPKPQHANAEPQRSKIVDPNGNPFMVSPGGGNYPPKSATPTIGVHRVNQTTGGNRGQNSNPSAMA